MGRVHDMATVLYTHEQLVKWLEDAEENDPGVRREMAKIFQRANRRIQNLQNSIKNGRIGYSPALDAVLKYTGREDVFSKFHMVSDWDTMLEQTAQAEAFMNEETSTASGAYKWQQSLRNQITYRNGERISNEDMSKFMQAVYSTDGDTDPRFRDIAERYILSRTEIAVKDSREDMQGFIDEYIRNTEMNKKVQAERMADYVDSFAKQMYDVLNKNPFRPIN